MKPGRTIHNLWIYRWIFGGALLAGLIVWFMLKNSQEVTVAFPFFATLNASLGVALVLSAGFGALLMWAYLSLRSSLRTARQSRRAEDSANPPAPPRSSPTPPPHSPAETKQDVRS